MNILITEEQFKRIYLNNLEDFKSAMDNYREYGILYHGTSNPNINNIILPPIETKIISEKGRKKNLDKVFFTKSYKSAQIYAGRAFNSYGGNKRVLPIIPIGKVEIVNSNKGSEVFMADYAIVINENEPIEKQIIEYFKTKLNSNHLFPKP
jgi:hypothetical protein